MNVAGFVLGVVATALAVISLGWQAATALQQRPRPKLTPVIGRLTPDGLVTNDAGAEVHEALANATERPEDMILGVKVVNAGRKPFHVAGWAIRSDPDGTSLMPVEKPSAGTDVPHDVAPGGSAVFLTELQRAHRFARGNETLSGQPLRIVLTVVSGARTYQTKPVDPMLLSIAVDQKP